MKSDRLLKLSAFFYMILALCILLVMLWWNKLTGKALDGIIVTTSLFLVFSCFLLGYGAFRMCSGSIVQRRNFGIAAGIFCGVMSSLAGWIAGVIFGIPLLLAILGMPNLWKSNQSIIDKENRP